MILFSIILPLNIKSSLNDKILVGVQIKIDKIYNGK
jgi:hypothetical protein